MEPLIGIDLGTTNCTVTAIDESGKTKVLLNRDGEIITPSAVYFTAEKNKVIVGKRAKKKSDEDPKNLVLFVKREMGKDKEEVRQDSSTGEYHPFVFWDKTFSPEEISAYILKQLKADAEKVLGQPVKKAVITCPAYFGSREKDATRMAGQLAGLEILEVLAEPTAATLSYSAVSKKSDETVLVFDLGGGTFDVTVLQITDSEDGRHVDQIATDGDHRLGGKDWDDYMISHVVDSFMNKFGVDLYDERGSEVDKAFGHLRIEVERAKKELFSPKNTSATYHLEYGGASLAEIVSRKDFAEITQGLTDQCRTCTENVLSAAGKSWSDIDTILMVGSMSHCTSVQDALKEWSGKEIDIHLVDPKACVSEGAAIKAFTLCGGTSVRTLKEKPAYEREADGNDDIAEDVWLDGITKAEESGERSEVKIASATAVLSASIGIKGSRGGIPVVSRLLEKNTTYPAEQTKRYPLGRDNMEEVLLRVLEGESENPDNCMELGVAKLKLVGSHIKGDKVKVTIKMDSSGILQVEGIDEKSGEKVEVVIDRAGALTQEEAAQAEDDVEDCELV